MVAPERAGVHRDVGAAVGLARDQRDARHDGLAERVQQLRPASYDTVPLLADAGQVAGHVDQHDERHAERVAHPHEPGAFSALKRVEAAAEAQRVVGDDADRATTEAAQGGDDVRRPLRVQLDDGALVEEPVRRAGARRTHASSTQAGSSARSVSSSRRSRAALVGRAARRACGRDRGPRPRRRWDVHDAGATAVRLGTAETQLSTSSPVTERTTSGPVTKIRPSGPRMTMSVSAGPYAAPPAAGPSTTEICGILPDAWSSRGRSGPTAWSDSTPSARRAPPECQRPTIGRPGRSSRCVRAHDRVTADRHPSRRP